MLASPCTQLQHNPHQLKCTHGCKKWFKIAGGCTRHICSFHNAEAAMHPQQQSHAHHSLIPDEVIQSSPQLSYASPWNSQHTPCSLLDVPHGDIPMFDDPFFNNNQSINNDPLINNDPPACSESPLQDRTSIHRHPLINGT